MNLLLGVALVLGLMIMIHEWGHFIVARLFGGRVDVFSSGFGPRLFGWKRGATDYRVSALPFGGYVRMAGQDLSEVDSNDVAPTGAADELMSKPRWQRALISFAGPAVNLLFPVLLLTVYFVALGIPYPAFEDKPVVVTAVPANSLAATAGLHAGDKIISINGQPVAIDVERKGQLIHLVVTPQPTVNDRGETTYQIGVQVHEDTAYRRVAFLEGARYASLVTTESIEQTVGVVGKLLSGRVSV